MTSLIQTVLPYGVLVSHIVLVIGFLSFLFKNTWGKRISYWIGEHSLVLGLIVALVTVLGSLFYSEVIGFEPCVLCWWQRVFLYPLLILFLIATHKRDRGVFKYALPLAVIAGVIAFYQAYANFGGASLLPCTAAEGACSRIYVMAFGYITIPLMSITVALYFILIVWANKIYLKNENSNA